MNLKKILSALVASAFAVSSVSISVFADGEKEVASYDELVAALANGDSVVLTSDIVAKGVIDATNADIDLAKFTLTLADKANNNFFGESTISNGTISIDNVEVGGDCIIGIGDSSNDATLNLEDVNLIGSNYSSAFAVLMVYGEGTLNVTGGEWTLSNELSDAGGVIKNENGAGNVGSVNIKDTVMNFKNISRGITGSTAVLDGVKMTVTGGEHGINGAELTVKNGSVLNISDGAGRALTVTDYDVTVEDSELNFSNMGEGDIRFKTANELKVDEESVISKCTVYADNVGASINGKTVAGTEDVMSTVKVEGGETVVENKIVARIGKVGYKTVEEALNAAKDDDTITIYTEEKIKMPGLGSKKDVTIQAADGVDAKIEITTPGLSGSDVTFNDVTLDYSNTGYKGLQHSGDLTYNNCTILGQAFLYGESDTFNNCTFEQSDVNSYNVWTYSSKSATFNNCTFNSIGRSVLVYREGGNDIVNVALNDCEFNATVPADGKAAIEIDPSLASFGVEINNCTANGFSAGSVSGNSLYNNKKAATKDKTSLIVVVDDEVVVKDVPSSSATAIIGTTIYDSLADAVDAAVEGDIIVLLGNVELDATVEIDKNITIDGANFKVTGASLVNPATALLEGVTPFKVVNGATVTFKNITVEGGSVTTGSDYQQQASFGYAGDAINVVDANVVVEDSTLIGGSSDAEWTASIGNGIDATGTGSVNVLNSTVSAGIPGKAGTFYMAAIEAENTMALELKDVVLSSPKGNADRGTGGTDVINSGFDDNETPRTADVIVSGKITVDPNGGEMYNVPIKVKEGENVQLSGKFDEEYIADSIRVSFEEVEKADGVNGESDIYDIVLESTGNIILENGDTGVQKFINRLNSADITFMLEKDDDANIVYEILEKDGSKIEINSVNGSKDRYEFHYKNKDDADNGDTASKIVIGQVKITGYGEYTFKVNTNNVVTNMAHSTTTTDNIVDTYYPGGALEGDNVGDLVLNDEQNNGVISGEIKVPTKDLTINVVFNNKIDDNEVAYQDMKVVISGGDLSADIVKNLGNDEIALDDATKTYTVKIKEALTENIVYNVTVTGAGYRTARYEVKMDADKTLNFWNNVKDVATEIESGKDKMQTNFLAGDIVADNIINVYDLSAVVSYFGTTSNITNNFVMYDLNRDGMIDSRDVAYVLVSWNK